MTRKYHHPILVRKIFKKFECKCGQSGIQAIKSLVKNHQIKFHKIPTKSKKILDNHGALIILNHPYYAEIVAAICALPNREDIYFIITDSYYELIPNLRKYMIPVHIQHHTSFVGIKKYFNIGRLFYYPVIKTKQEAHTFNINSITKAAKLVNQGHIVIICPQGLRVNKPYWFKGVGHLVSQLNPSAPIINMFVGNSSVFDLFRLVPIANRVFPKLHVYYSKPITVKTKNPSDITKELENKFNQWVSEIRPNRFLNKSL
jgi:hypothetical protein